MKQLNDKYEFCDAKIEGHLLTVTIQRPEVMNAIHPPTSRDLSDVFEHYAANNDLWVCIITGAGDRAFSAGNDLKYQATGGEMFRVPGGFAGLIERHDVKKPIIAAVNGIAMGGGFEIALACDLIIASENAIFALPEPHVGLAALAGGLHRLPRQIGMKRAMSMILTGRRVSAEEGKNMGFVNEVVPAGEALATAKKWADLVLACAPLSIQASKEVAYSGLNHASIEEAMAAEYPSVRTMLKSKDFIEGPKAFVEKRSPNWQGE